MLTCTILKAIASSEWSNEFQTIRSFEAIAD